MHLPSMIAKSNTIFPQRKQSSVSFPDFFSFMEFLTKEMWGHQLSDTNLINELFVVSGDMTHPLSEPTSPEVCPTEQKVKREQSFKQGN